MCHEMGPFSITLIHRILSVKVQECVQEVTLAQWKRSSLRATMPMLLIAVGQVSRPDDNTNYFTEPTEQDYVACGVCLAVGYV